MSGTSNAPSKHTFSSLPDFLTYKDFATVCKAYGLRVYTRANITKLMTAGKFPAPLYLHERPMYWRREDVLAWFRGRGVDASLCQE